MSITDLLNSGGAPSFKFAQIGATVRGAVVSADIVQKRNFDTGQPETWEDGSPVNQIRVVLQTELRDPQIPDDDGQRAVYIKGWGDQLRELRRAIKAAGANDLEPGGTFTDTYTGDGELSKGRRGFPPKVHAYTYTRPSSTAGLLNDTAAPVRQETPAPAAAAEPVPSITPEQLAAMENYQRFLAQQKQNAS